MANVVIAQPPCHYIYSSLDIFYSPSILWLRTPRDLTNLQKFNLPPSCFLNEFLSISEDACLFVFLHINCFTKFADSTQKTASFNQAI